MLTGRVGLSMARGAPAFRSLMAPVNVLNLPRTLPEEAPEEIEMLELLEDGRPARRSPFPGEGEREREREEGQGEGSRLDPLGWIPRFLPFLSTQDLPFFLSSAAKPPPADEELQEQRASAQQLREREQAAREAREAEKGKAREEEKGKTQGEESREGEERPSPRHPVVLCHGFMGFDILGSGFLPQQLQLSYWGSLPSALRETGVPIFVTRVPPMADVSVRAEALLAQLAAQFPNQTLNLVGHSMGGLDCRFLASQLLGKMEPSSRPFEIASITTLVTPHRGSSFADWMVEKLGVDRVMEARLLKIGLDIAALSCLTTSYCQQVFNQTVKDVPGIRYFSYGAQADPAVVRRTPLGLPFKVIFDREGPNDGLVSVESSKWGEYQETLDADHLDMIDIKPRFLLQDPAKQKFAAELFIKIFNTLQQNGC